MSAWIISIAAIAALGVLVDILLPESQTNKYIKGVFAAVTVLSIIAPLPAFFNREIDFSELFDDDVGFTVDSDFSDYVSSKARLPDERRLLLFVRSAGFEAEKVKIVGKARKNSEIDYVNVYLSKGVNKAAEGHIDMVAELKEKVARFLNIDCDRVRVL